MSMTPATIETARADQPRAQTAPPVTPVISVVIPAADAARTLTEAVDRVLASTVEDFEILVVDDASVVPVADGLFTQRDPRVRIVRHDRRQGAAASRNHGARAARGDVLLFLDADVLVQPNTLGRVLQMFRADDTGALVGLYNPSSRYRNVCSRFYNLRMAHGILESPDCGDICLSAIFAIRRELFLDTGGFSARFRGASVEDTEYGLRLFAQGHPIRVDRQLRVHHAKEFSLVKLLWNDFRRAADRVGLILERGRARQTWQQRGFSATPLGLLLGAVLAPVTVLSALLGMKVAIWWWAVAGGLMLTLCWLNQGLLRRFRQEGGLKLLLAGVALLPLDLTVACFGIVWGGLRHLTRGIRRYAGYLPHLRHFVWKRSPAEITLFVTNACNAKCTHCFYHENLNVTTPGMLTYDELAKLGRGLRPLLRVLISGGEPFLRADLDEVVAILVREARLRHVTIPTNGLLTERTAQTMERMLARCPDTTINVSFSILGLEKTHDAVADIPGAYQRLLKTYTRMTRLKQAYPNLLIGVIMTQSRTNETEIEAAYDFVRNELKPDNISYSLVRGAAKDESEMTVNIEVYKRVVNKIKTQSYRGRFPFWRLFAKHKHLLHDFVVKIFEQDRYYFPCYSGRTRLIITPEGNVYPCEILMLRDAARFQLGHARQGDGDIRNLQREAKYREINRWIVDSKCHCRHECDMSTNLFFNPRMLLKYLWKKV